MNRLIVIALMFCIGTVNAQTMTFDTCQCHPGFTFANFTGSPGTIWIQDLAQPATITVDMGTFDLISFDIGPFAGGNTIELTSDQGDTLVYNSSIVQTHTVNWTGLTSIQFERIGGIGASADIDNIVHAIGAVPCTDPVDPTGISGDTIMCPGDSVTLTRVGGQLNDADNWIWYTGSCGGVFADTSSSITISPTSTTTYYIRAEGICTNPSGCASVTVQVLSPPSVPQAMLVSPANEICAGESVTLSINGGNLGGADNWYWYSDSCGLNLLGTGDTLSVSPTDTTSYHVRAEGCGSPTVCVNGTVLVSPAPATPTVTQVGADSLTCDVEGDSYTWFFGLTPLSATTQTIFAGLDGNYSVVVTADGCDSEPSPGFIYMNTGVDEQSDSHFQLAPNPASEWVSIRSNRHPISSVEVCDLAGRVVLQAREARLNVANLQDGIYFVRVNGAMPKRLMVRH